MRSILSLKKSRNVLAREDASGDRCKYSRYVCVVGILIAWCKDVCLVKWLFICSMIHIGIDRFGEALTLFLKIKHARMCLGRRQPRGQCLQNDVIKELCGRLGRAQPIGRRVVDVRLAIV